MDDKELTQEAKALIRKYMVSLVTLPGLLVSVVLFLLGYLVNEVATGRAYNEAYTEASNRIIEPAQQAAVAANDALRAKSDIEALQKELRTVQSDALQILQKLKTAEMFQRSEELVGEIVSQLALRNDLRQNIVAEAAEQLQSLSQLVDSAHRRISGLSLRVVKTSISDGFGCGSEWKSDSNNLLVMYGSRDGTGCGVENLNYYKQLGLSIPE